MNNLKENCYLSFRVPMEIRKRIDSYCLSQDQTKSQFFRKLLKQSPIAEIQINDNPPLKKQPEKSSERRR
jgi:hypothetical protein